MHPEFLRELSAQHGRELQAGAHQARLARILNRAGRRSAHAEDDFVLPAIPDFVDGSFRTEEQQAVTPGRIPAARRAA